MPPPIITGLARANKNDIDKAWEAVQGAVRPRIHTFIATSDIHMEHKLRMSRDEVLETVGDMVQYARSLCQDVEFSPEDAGRSDPEFLVQVLERGDSGRRHHARTSPTPSATRRRRIWRADPLSARERAGRQGCDLQRALPQRPGAGHRQHAGRIAQRRASGGGDRQRHRRASRQHQPGRSGDGALCARPHLRPGYKHCHVRDPPRQRHGQPLHGHGDPAQQGHCGRQCLCT